MSCAWRRIAEPSTSHHIITHTLPPTSAFNEICDRLTSEILAELGSKYEMPTEAIDWIRKMIEYNVKGGKLNRGLTVRVLFTPANQQGDED